MEARRAQREESDVYAGKELNRKRGCSGFADTYAEPAATTSPASVRIDVRLNQKIQLKAGED
jgi:hypothetical protein